MPDAVLQRGARISVYWEHDDAWYDGTIRDYNPIDEQHLVVYDDGDQRSYNFVGNVDLKWKSLDASPPTPAAMPLLPSSAKRGKARASWSVSPLPRTTPVADAPMPQHVPSPPSSAGRSKAAVRAKVKASWGVLSPSNSPRALAAARSPPPPAPPPESVSITTYPKVILRLKPPPAEPEEEEDDDDDDDDDDDEVVLFEEVMGEQPPFPPPQQPPQALSEGDRVTAQWGLDDDELWFDGVVVKVHDGGGLVDVLYDDGDQECEKPAERVLVRAKEDGRKGGEAAKRKRSPAAAKKKGDATSSCSTSTPSSIGDGATMTTLWPGGGTWQPTTNDWGTRAANAFGCGKCRWRPSGCRGCVAAAATYKPPPTPPLPPGAVLVPSQKTFGFCYSGHHEGLDRASRLTAIEARGRDVAVVTGPTQSDANGYGVVARRSLRKGETLVDWSVFYVARPPDYALAHLPQFHALGFGLDSYFLLREPALGLCSLTYYVNEARGHVAGGGGRGGAAEDGVDGGDELVDARAWWGAGGGGPPANVAYKVVRPRDGGIALALHVLVPITEGEELLANYDQKLAFAQR